MVDPSAGSLGDGGWGGSSGDGLKRSGDFYLSRQSPHHPVWLGGRLCHSVSFKEISEAQSGSLGLLPSLLFFVFFFLVFFPPLSSGRREQGHALYFLGNHSSGTFGDRRT